MDILIQALTYINLNAILAIIAATAFGLFVGAIPGLTATMAVALMVPFTFFLDPIPALALMIAVGASSIYAGDIPGALLRIPGTPASAAYVADSNELVKQGKSRIGTWAGEFGHWWRDWITYFDVGCACTGEICP